MQPHEGPPRNRDAEERQRQRSLTKWLAIVIALLVAAIAAKLFYL
jgi:hypothetical protein